MGDDAPEQNAANGKVRHRPTIVENPNPMRNNDKAGRDTTGPSKTEADDNNTDDSEPNFIALGLGFLVVLALLLAGWFLVNQMRCNPLYSNAGLAHSRDCR